MKGLIAVAMFSVALIGFAVAPPVHAEQAQCWGEECCGEEDWPQQAKDLGWNCEISGYCGPSGQWQCTEQCEGYCGPEVPDPE